MRHDFYIIFIPLNHKNTCPDLIRPKNMFLCFLMNCCTLFNNSVETKTLGVLKESKSQKIMLCNLDVINDVKEMFQRYLKQKCLLNCSFRNEMQKYLTIIL